MNMIYHILILLSLMLMLPITGSAQTQQDGIAIAKKALELQQRARSKEELQNAINKYQEALRIFQRVGSQKFTGNTLNQLGNAFYSLGQYQKALEYHEKALSIWHKIGDVQGEAMTLSNIGAVYSELGQYQKALEYYQKALPINRRIGDANGEAMTLSNIGAVYSELGQYQKALEYYEKALSIRHRIGDVKGESDTLNNTGNVYAYLGQYQKALEYYQKALPLRKRIGDVQGEAMTLNNMGAHYNCLGQHQKALEYYEQSLPIFQRLGDANREASALSNIGNVYNRLGQYQKALEYYDKSLSIAQKIGDMKGEAMTLGNIGNLYNRLGQYQKALEYYEKSLPIKQKIGDANGEANTLSNMGDTYTQKGDLAEALKRYQCALEICTRIGVPTDGVNASIGNLYLDKGELDTSEPYIRKAESNDSYARLHLLSSDYPQAKSYYEKALIRAQETQNADNLFISYTGLGKVYEALEDYTKSEEYYQKGMALTENLRSGLLPSERKNFFEVKLGGFYRSEPAKGLTRVRMKLNQASESIESSEVTRARAFSDVISSRSERNVSGVSRDILEKENSLVSKVAALKKELVKTDKEKQASRYENLKGEIRSAELDLNAFTQGLWTNYPAYAAVKYPRPVTLKESKLRPEEYVVVFDVSTEGVGVKLIKGQEIAHTFYTKWNSEDLENEVKRFRDPFEQLRLKDFDPSIGNALYKKLLLAVLAQVPEGVPLIIIPDGILATLPFEALVVGGKPTWHKMDKDWPEVLRDYPEGLTFLADEHPISYYQSITALTLARNAEAKTKATHKLLVVADPIFDLTDERAQSAGQTKITEQEKKNNTTLMQTIEDASQGGFKLKRLAQTTELSDNLNKIYGANCLTLTGLKANKLDFLTKVAPSLEQYSGIVFATHGVMSTHIPGLMEPFLALTMAPPGTDGFLKMSDVLGLKMNADIVALTACQTGLGKELSGEGVMSMGRAFQYAGAKSVLMSLWSVSESGSVMLTERFFQHLKEGKSKLESLKAAREDIKNAGYKHPFFWSAFILVGEAS